jgi:hypothetical protein
MTNHRPDIHCDGCGSYSHSLSHKPWEQEFPEQPFYCGDCQPEIDKGIKTREMLNFEWYKKTDILKENLDGGGKLSQLEREVINSFVCTMHVSLDGLPEKKVYNNRKIKEMTPKEWQEISLQKLGEFKMYCNKTEFDILNKFISSPIQKDFGDYNLKAMRESIEKDLEKIKIKKT